MIKVNDGLTFGTAHSDPGWAWLKTESDRVSLSPRERLQLATLLVQDTEYKLVMQTPAKEVHDQ